MIIYWQNLTRKTLKQSLPFLQFPHVLSGHVFLAQLEETLSLRSLFAVFALPVRYSSKPKQSISLPKLIMVCAAGWGRIFTTGLTIMGLHFYKSY